MAQKGGNIFSGREREEVKLNLTPMIDAVFLLLIFFMVTTVFTQSHQLLITLPEAVNYDRLKEKKLNLRIAADGQMEVNGQLVDRGSLPSLLEAEKTKTASSSLIIMADARTPHGFVLDAMEIANTVGVGKVSVETDEPRGDSRRRPKPMTESTR